jgi:predicted RNA-binding Zn ribbon-like protein
MTQTDAGGVVVETPVDAAGRFLPEPGWPADRAAPGDLELVRRFCNSLNRENGADRFATAAGFDRWLAAESISAARPSRADLERIRAVREALHDLTVANRDQQPASGAWRRIAAALSTASYVVRADPDQLTLVPTAGSATGAFLARLALICMRARDDGTFDRLKSCSHCEWTVYDNSKNRNGRWCMVCGGRHNARTYRRRKRTTAAAASSSPTRGEF